MTLNREAKFQIIQDYYALDKLIFGKHIKSIQTNESLATEYVATKGSLLSVVIEEMKVLEFTPNNGIDLEKINAKKLSQMAESSAINSRKKAIAILSSEKGISSVKSRLREEIEDLEDNCNLREFVETGINKQALSIAIDHLLLGPVVRNSKKLDNHATWEGRIVEDSYKILRDSLVETSIDILSTNTKSDLYDDDDDDECNTSQ